MKLFEYLPYYDKNPHQQWGIEIEVESSLPLHNGDHPNKYWYYEEDGSLRNQWNHELVLKKPLSKVNVKKALDYQYNKYKENNCVVEPSVRTGVHVHYNCLGLTQKQIVNIILVYLTMERVLTRYCGEDRDGNLFCFRARDCGLYNEYLKQSLVTGNWHYLDTDKIRYSSLNLTALMRHGTLEFRAFKTPEDIREVYDWVCLLDNLCNYALNLEFSEKIPYDLSYHGFDMWIRQVLGDEYFAKVWYEGMEKDVKHDMRTIQMLYHTKITPWKEKKEEVKKVKVELDLHKLNDAKKFFHGLPEIGEEEPDF